MSSSRLPGKVLLDLAGSPALVQMMRRVSQCAALDESLVATSDDESDDVVADTCARHGISCHRGPLDDVLGRYVSAARMANADTIVRVTGDCPLHDASVIGQCIQLHREHESSVDYTSNVDERRTFPRGLDTEVFSRDALEDASQHATSSVEREHVTPYIRRVARKQALQQAVDLSMLRWTLDSPDDVWFIQAVYSHFSTRPDFNRFDVYRTLRDRPDMLWLEPGRKASGEERTEIVARLTTLLTTASGGPS
jgi:spore coat polysaccharide biosynthesis protein SpsF (cytidylyltransferase family)